MYKTPEITKIDNVKRVGSDETDQLCSYLDRL